MATRAHAEPVPAGRVETVGSDPFGGRRFWLSAVALTLLASGLRLSHLGDSLFGDELFLYLDVHGRSLDQVLTAVHDLEKTPPLGFLLSWVTARGAGADVLVRLPSLLAGIAVVPLVAVLGRRAFGAVAGLVGAGLIAISPFAIFYGSETRSYALVTALVLASTVSLVNATDGCGRRWWALYVAAATATVYAHYIGALVLVPQAAWAAWARRTSIRSQLVAHAAVVLLFVPWLPSFLVQVRHSDSEAAYIASVQGPLLPHTGDIVVRALGGHPFATPSQLPGVPVLVALGIVIPAAAVLWMVRGCGGAGRPSSLGALVVLLVVAPPALLLLYSLRPNTSLLLARNLSVATPYAFSLVAWLLVSVRPPRLASVLSVLVLMLLAVGTFDAVSSRYARPDARDAASFIDSEVPPGALLFDQEQADFDDPPAQALRIHLRPKRAVLPVSALGDGWNRALAERRPIAVAFHLPEPTGPVPAAFDAYFGPPEGAASRFRLMGQHRSDGFQPIVVRWYGPR